MGIIFIFWIMLAMGMAAEPEVMIFSVEKDDWDTAPPHNQLLFIEELAKIYISKYPRDILLLKCFSAEQKINNNNRRVIEY